MVYNEDVDTGRRIRIRPGLDVPLSELHFRFSRSGGPGGQHVNRSATRVELLFDVARSPSLSEEQRAKLLDGLSSRLDSEGILHLISQESRSQTRNREELLQRFRRLLASALTERRSRRATRPPRQAIEKRLANKKRRGEIKRRRKPPDW